MNEYEIRVYDNRGVLTTIYAVRRDDLDAGRKFIDEAGDCPSNWQLELYDPRGRKMANTRGLG